MTWLGLLARRMQRFSCCATRSPCYAARSADHNCPGPTRQCSQPWPGFCPPLVDGIASSPGHNRAVAPGPGEATLDPAPTSPNRRPAHHLTGAAAVGAARGRRELALGLPAHPQRTRPARLPDRGKYRVVDSQASRHRSRASPRRAKLAAIPAGTSPGHSGHRLLLRRHATAPTAVCAVRSGAGNPTRSPPGSHRRPEWCLGCPAGAEFSDGPRRRAAEVTVLIRDRDSKFTSFSMPCLPARGLASCAPRCGHPRRTRSPNAGLEPPAVNCRTGA